MSNNNYFDAAFQGARGAYSELAAIQLVGHDARMLPSNTLDDVFRGVAEGRARYGVVPLENTIAGTVPGVYELLLANQLFAIAETRVHIDHALIGRPGMALAEVRRVLSHPVALDQCRAFLARHPHIAPVAAFDTAGAVEIIMRENDGSTAAIAGRHAAQVYGGEVLAEHLQDHPENWTRFVLLGRPEDRRPATHAPKVLVTFDLQHTPGSLVNALRAVADFDVNLTKIESRPIPTRPFEYRFIVELTGGRDPSSLDEAMTAMRARTAALRVLGEFEAFEEGPS